MSLMATIGSLIFVLAALVLAVRGLRGHNLPTSQLVKYALIWGVIILGVMLVFGLFIPS